MTRILLISDGANPLSTTGYGYVSKYLIPELLKLGEVSHWALGGISPQLIGQLKDRPELNQLSAIYPTANDDVVGIRQGGIGDLVYPAARPDLVLIQADLGQVGFQIQTIIRVLGEKHCPVVIYSPVEGAPLMPSWQNMINRVHAAPDVPDIYVDGVMTVTQYGQEVIHRSTGRTVPYTYYGLDHDYWKPTTPEDREHKRRLLGWNDKFIAMYVATNVERKQHPRLFKGLKYAVDEAPSIFLYDHTKPFNNFWLNGHNLLAISDDIGVADHVLFNSKMNSQETTHYQGLSVDVAGLSLLDYYQCADVYVHTAHVEGFGLPLAEAMACGLPVINVPYGAGWEVTGKAALGLDIIDWTYESSGSKVAKADPKSIGRQLLRVYKSKNLREELKEKSLARAAELPSWDACATSVANYVKTFI